MTSGGKRPGAGRKPAENPKVAYNTRIRPDLVTWLKEQRNAAREIETALDEHIKK